VFRAKGVSTFAGFTESFNRSMSMPGDLSDNGRETSYGAGVNLGALYDFSDKFSIGVGYHSKINMTEFDDYADLFAEDGDFDIPPAATIGIALKPTNKVTLAFDIQKIWYSEVASVGNDFDNLLNCPSLGGSDLESCLGGKNGPGFGWDDIEVYKIGAQVEISPTLTLRGGFSTTNQPINDSEVLFNILAPGVVEEHYTLGLTKRLSNDSRISLSFMYAPTEDVKGANPFDPTQTIELEMKQYEFGIGWSKDL
jgi:long-chain fatty acid transport protein